MVVILQALCRNLAPKAELASITNSDLHSRLVSLVTNDGQSNPVLTWLGATVKASTFDTYSEMGNQKV